MKTTLGIPEPTFRKAQVQAAEQGVTLKELLVAALEEELSRIVAPKDEFPGFGRRKLRPEFKRLELAGAFSPKPGAVTSLI